jgi:class 3 adenylate cyclase
MVACASCGTENPDGFRMCGMCGAPLVPLVEARRQRRVVSVLFVDLVGYTRRSERLDVEDVEAFLAPYHDLLREEVERTGGVITKFIGDGMMALFGAPVAHEDDPERAVRCGLAICSTLANVLPADADPLHVRVGVTTGEALVVLQETGMPDAVGDVVNTAARLESMAPVDRVLVDEWTYRATSRAIVYARSVEVAAKGKSEQVMAWEAVEPVSAVPEQVRIEDQPLVGRLHEMQQLEAVLGRSWQDPSTQLVTLVGPPGIGKSRLLRELAAHVSGMAEQGRWLRGRSLAYGDGVAFWALGEIVKDVAGIQESDPADTATAKLAQSVEAIIDSDRDRTWVDRNLRSLVGLESDTDTETRGEAFGAWKLYLEGLAEQGPVVVVFEDIHWADDAMLDFIDLLTERAGDVPLLLVCTSRPELFERRPGWGGGKGNSTTISLSRLTDDETGRLVDGLLHQMLGSDEVARRLAMRAEGNPLYAQEYVRMLLDRGLLRPDPGGWQLIAEPEGLPESVYGIIAARLDTLSQPEQRFVHDAAVVGRTAWIGAVCALAELERSHADDILHVLERKQLMRRARRSSIDGDIEFTFGHALIQDVAYSQLRRTERAEKHERAAAWIEQVESGREDRAELIAHHYQTALRLHPETGEKTAEAAARACTAMIAAARQASSVNAYAAAVHHLDDALTLMEAEDPERAPVVVARAFATYRAGAPDTEEALEAGYESALAAGDEWSAAELALLLGDRIRESAGDFDQPNPADLPRAERWWQEADRLARRSGNNRVRGQVAYSVATTVAEGGDHEAAARLATLALREAEQVGDSENAALLQTRIGTSRVFLGDPSAVEQIAEGTERLKQGGSRFTEWGYAELSFSLSALGDYRRAWEAARDALPWAERFPEAVMIGDAEPRAAYLAYHAGAWEFVRPIVRRYVDDPAATIPAYRMLTHWAGALVAAGEGDDEICSTCVDAVREGGWPAGADILEAVRLHALGRRDEALAAAERAVEELLTLWDHHAPVLIAAAELISFPSLHQRLAAMPRDPPLDTPIDRAVGEIASGRPAEAAVVFEQLGSLPMAARSRMLAAAEARERNHPEGAQYAAMARSFYESVGATLLAKQAAALERGPV